MTEAHTAGVQAVMTIFDNARAGLVESITGLVADPAACVDSARAELQIIAPTLAYLETPQTPLARALFFCAVYLSVFMVLRREGVDVHGYGAALLSHLNNAAPSDAADAGGGDGSADGSTAEVGDKRHPGEFDVEYLEPGLDYAVGFNIKSCAICYLYGQHDALALVPYMCATDDVMSDQRHQGLRRTGTIALGATHCDFRYQPDGPPQRVAEAYPDRIRFVH